MKDKDLFDAHSDIPHRVVRERNRGREEVIRNDFLPDMEKSGIKARVASVYLDPEYIPEKAVHRAVETIELLYKDVEETENLEIVTGFEELEDQTDSGNFAFLLGMEGAEPIQDNLNLLDMYYRLGVRVMNLTHSHGNLAAEGASLSSQDEESTSRGLSSFGGEVVQRMNELGMAIDVSHLNQKSFWDVMEITEDPVIASHSNARAIEDHPRNLTDEQLEAIADEGGVIGAVCGVDDFVSEEDATLEDFLDHIDHLVKTAGIDHVGIGLDYFGYLRKYVDDRVLEELGEGTEGIKDDSEAHNLIEGLQNRGYSEKEIQKICHENFFRVLKEII